MPLQPEGPAPYAPSAAVLSVVDRARERGLPSPVTKDVLLRAGISESLMPRTLQALQQLELINEDGTWTKNLDTLRRCPASEFQSHFAEIIRAVYADVFQYVDPAKDSQVAVRDAFRSFTPHGQQDRMVMLFLGLCQKAGIIDAESQQKTTPREARVVKKAGVPQKPGLKGAQTPLARGTPPPFDGAGLAPPIAGLLAALPKAGSGWTQQDRDRFMAAFGTIVDFCVPIRDKEPNDVGDLL